MAKCVRKALAGVSLLSTATIPSGVDLKSPRLALPIRLMAAWYIPSTPFLPFQVSSEAYSMVPWTIAIWRFGVSAGGTPCLLTILRSLASAWRVLPIRRRRFSLRVSVESSQIPSQRVASLAKRAV